MKRFLSIFLSIAVMVTLLVVPVFGNNLPTVTVESIEEAAAIGDEVKFEVSVSNNPGFTNSEWYVKYDTDRLELEDFKYTYEIEIPGYGALLQNYAIQEFDTKMGNASIGKIALATYPAYATADSKLFGVVFTVKENAPSGEAKVWIESQKCNNDGTPVEFTYVAGTVNVDGIDCDEGHDYGEWQTRTEPKCEEPGEKYRVCQRKGCKDEDTEEIPQTGHVYGDWEPLDEVYHQRVCKNDSNHIETDEHSDNQNCPECGYVGSTTGGSTTGGSTTGGSTTGGTTTGGSTTGGEESPIPSIGETTGWEDIKNEITNSQEESFIVEMNGAEEVPAEVFETIAQNKSTVEFNLGGGVSWTINGEDIPENLDFSEINLNVQMDVTTIPTDVVEEVEAVEAIQVELTHDGEFGFTMYLNVELGSENAGLWANLYYFNISTNSLEFQEAVRTDENGNAKFEFSHASNYVIAVDDKSHGTGGSTTGGSTTGGSTTGGSTTGGSTTGGSTTGGSTTGGSTTGGSTTGGSTTGGSTTGGSTTGGSTTSGSTTGGSTTGGSTTGGCETGHSYGDWIKVDDLTHKKVCDCGDTITEAHTWDAGIETTPATHTTKGEKTYTCTATGCGATKTEDIDKLEGHTYGDWIKVDDLTHKKVCACGDTITEAHTWDAGVVTDEPSYTSTGVKTYTCTASGCGATKTEIIDALTRPASTGLGGTVTYTVDFETNGADSIAIQRIKQRDLVNKPQDPQKEGYVFDGWYIDEDLTVLYNFDTPVTKSFTLYARWIPEENKETENPEETEKISYNDVNDTDWFYDAVQYVTNENIMNGVLDNNFAPMDTLTRSQLVTVLYRIEKEPPVDRIIPFQDVDLPSYYKNAVTWAKENNIVNGVTDTEFAPDMTITREQIATILYRYCQYKGYDISAAETTDIQSYMDADKISEYAVPAMKFVVGIGLITGRTSSTLNPRDYATRAEIAQILYNFFK